MRRRAGDSNPSPPTGGHPPKPPDGCEPSARAVAAIRRSLVEVNLLRRGRAASGAVCVVVMTPRGFHYSAGPADCAQARRDAAPNGLRGIALAAPAQLSPWPWRSSRSVVFCLSVWGCLLCGSSVCLVVVVVGFAGRAALVLMCAASCCGCVLPVVGGAVACLRVLCLCLAVRCGGCGGGCALALAVVLPCLCAACLAVGFAVVGCAGCRSVPVAVSRLRVGWLSAVASEAGCAGGGGVGCRRRFCRKKFFWHQKPNNLSETQKKFRQATKILLTRVTFNQSVNNRKSY